MKTIAIVFASFCVVGAAMAQTAPAPAPAPAAAPAAAAPAATGTPADTAAASCQTTMKPGLKGAALKSSATKCCKAAAKTAKLSGAAATSFDKKCISDLVPPPAPPAPKS
jgi:hypothetical protein